MKKIFGVALLVSFGSFLSAQYMIIGKDSISLDQYKKEYKYGLENNGIEKNDCFHRGFPFVTAVCGR